MENERKGILESFHTDTLHGIIVDQENNEWDYGTDYVLDNALCKYLLRCVQRFRGAKMELQPHIPVRFVPCLGALNQQLAGYIVPDGPIPGNDPARKKTGFIKSVTWRDKAKGVFLGWISDQDGPIYDRERTTGFDSRNILQPTLRAYLQDALRDHHDERSYVGKQQIVVNYWEVFNPESTRPTAIFIHCPDQRRVAAPTGTEGEKYRQALERLTKGTPRYCYEDYCRFNPLRSQAEAAREAARERRNQAVREGFLQELRRVTQDTPASFNAAENQYWTYALRGDEEGLKRDMLDNLRGTKMDLLLQAACCYTNGKYMRALRYCARTESWYFGALLAEQVGQDAVAQRMIERAGLTEKALDALARLSARTGDGRTLCGWARELLELREEEDPAIERMWQMAEQGCRQLLEQAGADSHGPAGEDLVDAALRACQTAIPALSDLLAGEAEEEEVQPLPRPDRFWEADGAFRENDGPAEGPASPAAAAPDGAAQAAGQGQDTNGLQAQFDARLRTEEGLYRAPGPGDADLQPLLIQLLDRYERDGNENAIRLPLLALACLSPEEAKPRLTGYLSLLEEKIQRKRRDPAGDRRWKLAKGVLALLEGQGTEALNQASIIPAEQDMVNFLKNQTRG